MDSRFFFIIQPWLIHVKTSFSSNGPKIRTQKPYDEETGQVKRKLLFWTIRTYCFSFLIPKIDWSLIVVLKAVGGIAVPRRELLSHSFANYPRFTIFSDSNLLYFIFLIYYLSLFKLTINCFSILNYNYMMLFPVLLIQTRPDPDLFCRIWSWNFCLRSGFGNS